MYKIEASLSAAHPRASCRHRPLKGIHESDTMPVLRLEMHPGRTLEQKRAFVQEATRITVETLQCPPDSVEIVITEVSRDAWAKGGKLRSDG
ncbi:MAG TPA: 4-oxalocrotonate tautomerase [Pinirhizobacter sp.]|uniref:4-oxalocrotonate tautomerase n=1 Tax=Pinirhizobacter sp. TaxID=2950432 RepID=UPI002B7D5CCE|nr:4-oxalocrotonate tautomerase [Pinirhizobacter sp.]HMH68420.1 4-oxalocrotonate tautomerase [Pinirhizobacter sp.]